MERSLRHAVDHLRRSMPEEFAPVENQDRLLRRRDIVALAPDGPFWSLERGRNSKGVLHISDEQRTELGRQTAARSPTGRRRARRFGVDVLAWYRAFHYYDEAHWGIYLTVDGLAYIAGELLEADGALDPPVPPTTLDEDHLRLFERFYRRRLEGNPDDQAAREGLGQVLEQLRRLRQYRERPPRTPLTPERALQAAAAALLRHEEFHYQVEVFATSLELTTERPAYRPYKEKVYRPLRHTADLLEEALANRRTVRYAWHRYGGPHIRQVIEQVCDNAPLPYREWRAFAREPRYSDGLNLLASQIHAGGARPSPKPAAAFFPGRAGRTPVWRREQIPLYLVGEPIPSAMADLFFSNLNWREFRRWLRMRCPAWYVPQDPSTHRGDDSKIWPSGRPGIGQGIPIKVYPGTRAVSASTLKDVARVMEVPPSRIGG